MIETGSASTKNYLGFFAAFAFAKILVHLVVGEGYGYFRDEFYYIACSDHLAWGYVDHPPLSIALLRVGRMLFGESVMAIRWLPVLAGAATVVVVGWMTRRIGGGRFAQSLAMISVIVAPIYLGLSGFYSMNAFDLLLWTVAAALLIPILRDGRERSWPVLGVVIGLGLLNKISMLWFGAGLGAGLLLTGQRRRLATPGPWIAAGIAAVMFAPHVLWQMANDWPTLEFIRNATGQKMVQVTPLDFVQGQILMMHPLTLPLWLAGLIFLMRDTKLRPLAVLYGVVFALLALNGTSRSGYLAPAYSFLLAAGAVWVERTVLPARRPVLRGVATAALVLGGLSLAPLAIALLDVEDYVDYAAALGMAPSTAERKELADLPQHYADMHGWEEIVGEVARVHATLSPEERGAAAVFTYNYGEAGAIDLLGRRYGLPLASSGHNNYHLWGLHGTGEVVIVIGGTEEGHRRVFERVELAGRTDCGRCMPYENDQPVFVCRGLKLSPKELWPQLAHFD